MPALNVDLLTDDLLHDCYEKVLFQYKELGGDDKVAKGSELVQRVKADLIGKVRRSKEKNKAQA